MNEKLQYAKMLDIPVTSTVTYKPPKKRLFKRRKKDEDVKKQLLDKINGETGEPQITEEAAAAENSEVAENVLLETSETETACEEATSTVRIAEKKAKKRGKFGIIGVQLCVIGALVLGIFLTDAFMADSGINTFIKGVFGGEKATVKNYDDFKPVLSSGTVNVNEGVITISGKNSIYAPCDGTVAAISKDENGTYTVEVKHSDNFKTLLTGLDMIYVEDGQTVFGNIPLGYVNGGNAKLCFFDGDGRMLNDFSVDGNAVIWAV